MKIDVLSSAWSWSPATPGRPIFDYDPAQLALNNNVNLTSFTDRSGAGKTLTTQFTGYPTYLVNQCAGKPAANFVFSSQQALIAGGAGAHTYPYTFGLIVKNQGDTSQPFTMMGPTAANAITFRINTSNQLEIVDSFTSVIAASTGTIPNDGKFHAILGMVKASGSPSVDFYIDSPTTAGATNGANPALSGAGTFQMGADENDTGSTFNGQIARAIGWSTYFSAKDIAGFFQWAKQYSYNFGTAATADGFVNMKDQTVGATVSANVCALGTQGTNLWTLDNAGSFLTVAANQTSRPTAVTCAGLTYASGTDDLSIAFLHTSASQGVFTTALPTGKTSVVISGWIKLGPPSGGTILVDLMGLNGNNGHYASAQLTTGAGAGTYGVSIETNPGGVTTHTTTLVLTSGTMYWFTLQVVYGTGIATLKVYDTASSLVGTLTSLTLGVGTDTSGTANFGVGAHASTFSGVTTYFQGIIIDYTNASYPRLP